MNIDTNQLMCWRLSKHGFDTEYYERKFARFEVGLVITGVNTPENKRRINDLIFNAKLLSRFNTITSKKFHYSYAEVNEYIEKTIWFTTNEDYATVLEYVNNEIGRKEELDG